jgi:hypothetical protein
MPISKRLLSRAYALASAGNIKDVNLVLDVVVRQEPNNVEAWEFYLQIATANRKRLEALAERIAASNDMLPQVKQEVLDYYNYLLRRLDGRERALARRRSFALWISLGIAIGVLIIRLRDRIPVSSSVSLLLAAAAAMFLADWIRKNSKNLLHTRRPLVRSYAQEASLVAIDEKPLDLEIVPARPHLSSTRRKRASSGSRPRTKIDRPVKTRPKVNLAAPGESKPARGRRRTRATPKSRVNSRTRRF